MIAYDPADARFRTPGGHEARFRYRQGTNDWNTLVSSITEDEYQLPANISGVAFDIGGYLGSVGIALALDNPGLKVFIVEPVPPNQELIAFNIAENNVADRVALIRGAVGQGGERVEVWYGYSGDENATHHAFVGNSNLAVDFAGDRPHETVTYEGLGLRDLLAIAGPIDYLKIDTEGGEWAFLDSHLLSEVTTIVGEWHPVRGHVIGDMIALLDETHLVTFSGPQTGPGGFRAVRR